MFSLFKLPVNPVASCSLKKFDFLLLHAEHFDKNINLYTLELLSLDVFISSFIS